MSPALAGGFLTTAPPGKSPNLMFLILNSTLTHINVATSTLFFSHPFISYPFYRFTLSILMYILFYKFTLAVFYSYQFYFMPALHFTFCYLFSLLFLFSHFNQISGLEDQ